MVELSQYRRNFEPHAVPDALVKLVEFDNSIGRNFFSSGFELAVLGKEMYATYSDNPDFLNCLYPIGQASGSGSDYSVWCRSGTLESAPVVVFGDEGGVHLVADNLAGLLRILSFDAEPMVDWDSITYFKATDDEPSVGAARYVDWLTTQLGLDGVSGADEVEEIVQYAKRRHAKDFAAWFQQYYAG